MSAKDNNSDGLSPFMRQFNAVKEKHPDKILFFRMGDFYEMFGDDAVKAAPILGITLTSRAHSKGERIPLAGVPHHAADRYLARLLKAGEKVVVVEQVEDPKTAKGIVKRDIVEVLTPGTATIDDPDQAMRTTRLAAVAGIGGKQLGIAILDLASGEFLVDQDGSEAAIERLRVMEPAEIIFPESDESNGRLDRLGITDDSSVLTAFGEWNFDTGSADRDLNQHFGTTTLEGFGVTESPLGIAAAGAIFRYLKENRRDQLSHINRLTPFNNSEQMSLDYTSVRNLELVANLSSGSQENTLFSVMNYCHTSSGARRLQKSLLSPFRVKIKIELRLGAVAEFVKNRDLCYKIREKTKLLPDLERLAGRLGIGKLNPRQMAAIATALVIAKEMNVNLLGAFSPHLQRIGQAFPDTDELVTRLGAALVDDPPLTANKGNIFSRGHSTRLDELNDSIKDAREYIGSLQQLERERTGINSLKVGFNKVFGYYLEITKANSDQAPSEYIRKQTLVNAERYITPELKEKEELILAAEDKIFRLEEELYNELLAFLNESIGDLVHLADLLAETDLVAALAELAVAQSYSRPEIFEDNRLVIENGRHPVIEAVIPPGSFVSNDLNLNSKQDRIIILTGPNMSGKSTYLRQNGLIVIMAQIGSFVPADKAEIGLVDRVFTRVGALDNLARGQSTFLVEMVETANILNNATEQSLVLLDEVGRGTSTFDGLSVAWSVVEHINENSRARTVFATHFHELTGMAELYDHIHNFQVSVKKWEDKVIFMHKIIAGGCDDSYGIEVAKLAGLPKGMISRARQILRLLESGKFAKSELGKKIFAEKIQPSLFDAQPSATEEKIRNADIENMSPVEAFDLLRKLKEDLE